MLRTVLRMSQRKWRAGVARGEKVAVSGKAGLATLDKVIVNESIIQQIMDFFSEYLGKYCQEELYEANSEAR